MKELIGLLTIKGYALNTFYRVKSNYTPLINLTENNSISLEKKLLLKKAINKQCKHPLWLSFTEENSHITIYWTNETSKKVIDKQQLLGKENIDNTDKQIITQGFSRIFDLNNLKEKIDLIHFIKQLTTFFPEHKEPLNLNTVLNIHYQEYATFNKETSLLETIDLQQQTVEKLTSDIVLNKEIIAGHSALTVSKTNKKYNSSFDHFFWTQDQHKKMKEDNTFSPKQQFQHQNIDQKMEFAKTLTTFIYKPPII